MKNNILFAIAIVMGIQVVSTEAALNAVDIWVTKNNYEIWHCRGGFTNNPTSSFPSLVFTREPTGLAQSISRTPNGGATAYTTSTEVQLMVNSIPPENTLWRWEQPGGWVMRTIVYENVRRKAYDIGTGLYPSLTPIPSIWAVSEIVYGNNIWEFKNNVWNRKEGVATRIDVGNNGLPWCVNAEGDVWEWVVNSGNPNSNWVKRGSFGATDIGVVDGSTYGMVYAVTNAGQLKRYDGNNVWSEVTSFTALNKRAKRVDASNTYVIVSTTDGLLYAMGDPRFSGSFNWVRVGNISNVNDVTGEFDTAIGVGN